MYYIEYGAGIVQDYKNLSAVELADLEILVEQYCQENEERYLAFWEILWFSL